MNTYYVSFLTGKRVIVEALDKHDATAHATKESGMNYGDITHVFNAACFPDPGDSIGEYCIYCGNPVKQTDLICSDKCQRDHFGMGD